MAGDRQELQELRRLAELESRAAMTHPKFQGPATPEFDFPEMFTGTDSGMGARDKLEVSAARMLGGEEDVASELEEAGVPVRTDANGFRYAEFPNGEIMYLDRPETTGADVAGVVGKVAPYVATGAAVARIPGILQRGIAGAVGEGATDIGMQVGAGRGGDRDVDLVQSGGAAAGGGIGEAFAPFLSRLIPGGRVGPESVDGIPVYPANQEGYKGTAKLYDLAREEGGLGDEARKALEAQSQAVQQRLAPRQAQPREFGERLQETVSGARGEAKMGVDEAYGAAREVEGAGVSNLRLSAVNQNALRDLADDGFDTLPFSDARLAREAYPQAHQAMGYVQQMVDVSSRNAAMQTYLDPRMIEAGRQRMNRAYASAAKGSPDRAAVVKLRNRYEEWVDQQIADGMTFGDASWVEKFTEARGLAKEFFRNFTGRDRGNVRGKLFEDIADREMGGNAVANLMLGSSMMGARYSKPLIRHVRERFGDDLINEAKDVVMTKVVGDANNQGILPFQTVSHRLVRLLRSDLAPELFSGEERKAMGHVAQLLQRIARPAGSYKPSGPEIRALYSWAERIPPLRNYLLGSARAEAVRGGPTALGTGVLGGTGAYVGGQQQDELKAAMQRWADAGL